MSELRCAIERTSEWPSTYVSIHGSSEPQWSSVPFALTNLRYEGVCMRFCSSWFMFFTLVVVYM